MPSNHPILCHPLLLSPSVFPSVRVFSSESTLCIRWPKYWIFSFNSNPSDEYSGLISFQIDWFELLAGAVQEQLLAVQGTLKSLLQHHILMASILRCSAFFTVQLSHPYTTTRKTIALTRRTLVGKVMSLLLNMLCRFLIIFFQGAVSQFSCSAVSDSLQPHGLQHTRHPCPSPSPGVCPSSRPLSQ